MFDFFRQHWERLHRGVISAGITTILLLTVGTNVFTLYKRDQTTPIRIKTVQTEHRLRVKLSSTSQERGMGLMRVPGLPRNGGMLFVYTEPTPTTIWMKNMLIPIDILFIGKDFKIKKIDEEVSPCPRGTECTLYPSPEPVTFVLELPSGYVQKHQIQVGDELLLGY